MTIPDEKGSSPVVAQASPWIASRHTTFTVVWMATVVATAPGCTCGVGMADDEPRRRSAYGLFGTGGKQPSDVFVCAPRRCASRHCRQAGFLIGVEIVLTVVAAASAVLVTLNLATALILLLFTFLLGVGAAFTAPPWQSIMPQLVPKQDLAAAVASNGVGVNISRTIGPALGGVVIGGLGIAARFWINALSNFAVIGALFWWRPPSSKRS